MLPALIEELRNEAVQALALPLVLRIIAQQPPKDFMDVTLPALLPVATTVKVCAWLNRCRTPLSPGLRCCTMILTSVPCPMSQGEALALFTAGAILLAPSLPPEAVGSLIVPLLARAADHGTQQCVVSAAYTDPSHKRFVRASINQSCKHSAITLAGDSRAQEEMLKAVPALAELGSLSKDELAVELLPRVCGVCLATTSAPVRTAAVQAMGRLVKLVDDEQAAKMLATCQQACLLL